MNDTQECYTASFSLDDARRAGLVRSGGGWEKYASDMLFARCISRLARRLFADVISTAYVEGEIDRSEAEPHSAPIEVKGEASPANEIVCTSQKMPEKEMSITEFGLLLSSSLEEDFQMPPEMEEFLYSLCSTDSPTWRKSTSTRRIPPSMRL